MTTQPARPRAAVARAGKTGTSEGRFRSSTPGEFLTANLNDSAAIVDCTRSRSADKWPAKHNGRVCVEER